LVVRVREQLGEGEWKEALRGAYLLARYYPTGRALLVNDKPLLKRRLRTREEEVLAKERQLTELRKELQQERRQLKVRTQQLGRLRKRARRIEDKEQELQQRLKEADGSGVWEILKRLVNIQGKSSQK
jgi:septal ring factor EnvC (AmiA/AmiB activator)